jgi:hypothetical protein
MIESAILPVSHSIGCNNNIPACHRFQSRQIKPFFLTWGTKKNIRPKIDFLSSYKQQLQKSEYGCSSNPKSAFYVEEDTWLTDFEILIDAYTKVFGDVSVLS